MSFISNPLLKRVKRDNGSFGYVSVSKLPSRVDRSFAADADINVIVSRFLKTGVLPSLAVPPQFGDMTLIPRGTDALMAVRNAQQSFERLPLELQKELGHNIANFEPWLVDPKNRERAIQYGFLKPSEVSKPAESTLSAGPPVAAKNEPVKAPGPDKGAPQT